MRTLGTRADEIHIAAKNVPELRYLIDAKFANDLADARGAIVIFAGPDRSGFLGVSAHRAKLHHCKKPAVFPHAFLLVENRSARIQLDQDRRDDSNRQRKQRTNQGYQAVHDITCDSRDARLASTTGKDQPRRPNHVERDASGNALVKRRSLFNVYCSRQTQLQQLAGRQLSTPFSHRHDDAIDALALDHLVKIREEANHTWIDQALAEQFRIVTNEPRDAITRVGTFEHFARNLNRKTS